MPDVVTPAAAVPVGGGVIVPEHGVVVTQPVEGTFVAFSSSCPHRGCAVRAVAAGTINCFCHGSRFRITDGAVAGGPATAPLPQRRVVVVDGLVQLVRSPDDG
jgi:Rieske Fe-S protein